MRASRIEAVLFERIVVTGTDHVALRGYAANVVSLVLGTAVVSGGSTVLTLPDGAHVTFANVARLTEGDFV